MKRKSKFRSPNRYIRRIFYACFLLFVVLVISCVQQKKNVKPKPQVGQIRLCDVKRVSDGDTLWVECNGQREKLRLHCIDAPEMGQMPWGERSRDHLSSLIGRQLHIEYRATDKYGRTVAKVRDGVVDVGARMVLDGFAVVYPKYCPPSETDYYSHERHAKKRHLGLWSQPGLQSTPWVWRHNQ